MDVTKEEVVGWLANPVTQAVMQFLIKLRDDYEDRFALMFDAEDPHRAALLRGRSQGVQDVIDVKDLMFPEEDEDNATSSSA